jgi:predicted nucleic-acid-binding protein
MTLTLDANVIIRFLANDHPTHSPQAVQLFEAVTHDRVTLVVDMPIIAECVFVLTGKHYGVSREKVSEILTQIVEHPGIQSKEKDVLLLALQLFGRHHVDFVDAYLGAKAEIEKETIVTFNSKDFSRMGANHVWPAQVLENL